MISGSDISVYQCEEYPCTLLPGYPRPLAEELKGKYPPKNQVTAATVLELGGQPVLALLEGKKANVYGFSGLYPDIAYIQFLQVMVDDVGILDGIGRDIRSVDAMLGREKLLIFHDDKVLVYPTQPEQQHKITGPPCDEEAMHEEGAYFYRQN